MNVKEHEASQNSQRPTGTSAGKEVLDAELYQANQNKQRQTRTTKIVDCDAIQMAEEISLGRVIA